MQNKTTFFIIGNPGNNIGDISALEGMIYGLKKFIPNSNIYVSYSNYINIENIKENVNQFFKDEKFFSSKSFLLFFILFALGIKNDLNRAIRKTDIIIFAPGACGLHEKNFLHWIKILFFVICFKRLKKKIVFHACSMGPFSSHKNILSSILKRIDLITLRDKTSLKYLKDFGISISNITIAADSALMIPTERSFNRILTDSLSIGLTPVDMDDFNFEGLDKKNTLQIDCYVNVILYLSQQYKINEIRFLKHIINSEKEDAMINKIERKLSLSGINTVILNSKTPEEAFAEYSKLDFCISARHHGGAFSLKSGVPAICIGYEHKALGFFEQCNLDDYVIDISNLSVDGLKEKVDLLLSKYKEVVEIIEQNMPVMEDNATITPRKILELIST